MNVLMVETFATDFVLRLLPNANRVYIKRYWPLVYVALEERGLDYKEMLLMALATIAVETGNFNIRIREYESHYNTDRGMHPFNRYDDRSDLGNRGRPDGYDYRGGGAIQLTGRDNYSWVGRDLNIPLGEKPELIENPIVSARALALFLKRKQRRINTALYEDDLKTARRLVNGGSHGLSVFRRVYRKGINMLRGVE